MPPLPSAVAEESGENLVEIQSLSTLERFSRKLVGPGQGISKYYTTQVAPTRVETLREIAKTAKSKLVDFFRETRNRLSPGS